MGADVLDYQKTAIPERIAREHQTGLVDYITLFVSLLFPMDVLIVLRDTSFVYFTSDKSSILELCEWMERNHVLSITPLQESNKGHSTSV